MKKNIYKSILATIIIIGSNSLQIIGQCVSTTNNPSGTINVSPMLQTIVSGAMNPNNYAVINIATAGEYQLNTSFSTSLTVTDNSNVPLATGNNALNVSFPTAGLYRVHVCASNGGGSRIVAISPKNRAFNFDGINDFIDCGIAVTNALKGKDKLTVEAWVYPTQNAVGKSIIGNHQSNTQFDIQQAMDKYTFFIGFGSYAVNTPSNSVVLNTWQHVAGVFDDNVLKIYLNGVLSGTTAVPSSYVLNASCTTNFWIGKSGFGGEEFQGSVDEVRIWDRAVCQGEIQKNMNGIIPTTATNLLANYHFEHGVIGGNNATVTTLIDYSGNAFNGTVTNAALNGAISNWVASAAYPANGSAPLVDVAPTFTPPTITVNSGTINAGTSFTMAPTGGVTYTYTPSGPIVSPINTSTYSVIGTNSVGCVASAVISTVTVNAAALNFDGANDYVNIGNGINTSLNNTNKVTVEAWVKPSTNTGFGAIIGNYATTSGALQFLLRRQNNDFAFLTNNGGFVGVTAVATVTLNTWTHLAGTWDGATIRLFVNGVLSATAAATGSIVTTTDPYWIGGETAAGGEYFKGNIDEIRVWNTARTQCEINTYKNCEIATTATGLLANYHFNQGTNAGNNISVTTLTDAAGAYTGTLTNMPLTTGTLSNWVAPGGVTSGSVTPANLAITVGATVTNSVICSGNLTMLSGTGANTYAWTNSVINATSFSPTVTATYTVTGTNTLTGCTNTAVSTVTVNALPTVSVNVSNVLCNGGSTGSATATATGASPYTYVWSNGATTSAISNATPGVYTSTVTDAKGCNAVKSATITQPTALLTSSAVANVLCNGGTGSAAVNATGGTSPYSYLWSTGATTSSVSNVAGAYTATVTDANGCTAVKSVTITQPSAIVTASAVVNALCNGGSTGSATVTAVGGTSPYTYMASNGATVSAQSNLLAGTYVYTVTDGNGCNETQALTITEPTALNVASVANNTVVCAGSPSTLTANGTGGTGTITYTWVAGATSNVNTVSPTTTSIYTVDATDANNCVGTSTVEVTVNALPTVSVNSGSICSGQSFTMMPTGTDAYTYSNGSDVAMPTADESYTVTGTNTVTGCSNMAVSSVTVNVLPTVVAVTNNTLLCTGETATLSVSGSATTYTWSTTENTMDIAVTPTVQTTYTVDGTDANGCVNSTTIMQDVSACTGVNQLTAINNELNIYPNPSNGTFNVNTSTLTKVTILDVLGKVVYAESFEAGINQIDIHQQADGMYFLKAESNGSTKTIRLIKK